MEPAFWGRSSVDEKTLLAEAERAQRHAYAPYSGVKVGACVETASGETFSGCNVENASYGLTICAERAAIFAAVAGGHTRMKQVAIVADGLAKAAPCGACLQVMNEFGVERVILGGPDGSYEAYDLGALLPHPFEL
jgi:cytidine deaminase